VRYVPIENPVSENFPSEITKYPYQKGKHDPYSFIYQVLHTTIPKAC
jgi:hypothetical protein